MREGWREGESEGGRDGVREGESEGESAVSEESTVPPSAGRSGSDDSVRATGESRQN